MCPFHANAPHHRTTCTSRHEREHTHTPLGHMHVPVPRKCTASPHHLYVPPRARTHAHAIGPHACARSTQMHRITAPPVRPATSANTRTRHWATCMCPFHANAPHHRTTCTSRHEREHTHTRWSHERQPSSELSAALLLSLASLSMDMPRGRAA